MNWSAQQRAAIDKTGKWIRDKDKPFFYLAGYAGTGKTTLARHLADGVSGRVIYGAYTGKAAHVMRKAGCHDAQTIHSLIYQPKSKGRARLREMEEDRTRRELDGATHFELECMDDEIQEERENVDRPSFSLNPDSELKYAALLVIDECSMVSQEMAEDILSFDCPVLVLGDPAQLPPVFGTGFFTDREPDVMLTDIHRQAKDNPIIWMAQEVREGRKLDFGTFGGTCHVLKSADFDSSGINPDTHQVLVGKNVTRRSANLRIREGYLKSSPVALEKSDKIVCLRNSKELGLLNGSLWTVTYVHDTIDSMQVVDIKGEDGQTLRDVQMWEKHFTESKPKFGFERLEAEEFDYGYALTVHKSQGSQFSNVIVVDQSKIFKQNARRWLYTAITRAQETVTIVR